MKHLLLFTCFLLVCVMMVSCSKKSGEEENAMNKLTEQEIEEGWTLLFDGETTNGWRGYNKESFPEQGWEVVDGTLHCIGSGRGEAGSGGDIITEKRFKNFELKLEWKIAEGGNSGIFYLAQEKPGEPIWHNAPEMQVLDNERHMDANLGKNGNRQAGALYDLIPAEPQTTKPAGEWNQVKIYCEKGLVVHYMNGEKILEYHLWTPDFKKLIGESKFNEYSDFAEYDEGHIGLQDHGDDVWYRNIKIRELE